MSKMENHFDNHPLLAWFGSAFSMFMGLFSWLVEHADDGAKIFGVFAAIFGMIAGYYTMRIQRRKFHRGDTRPPI